MSTELAIRPDQTSFDEKQLAALRALGVQNAPAADVALLFHQAARTGLDPFARQIYLIGRGGKYNIQTGIDGFRVIRDRSKTYRGHTEEWCGPDGVWRDVWLDQKNPAAAKVSVHVAGYDVPIVGIARWTEYAQENSPTWKKMPALMLAKCAEALALRKAYPQDLSGLYTDDEIPAAEQDADGVYVTTTMRGTGTQGRVQESGHSKEPSVPHSANRDATRPAATGKGRGRPHDAEAPAISSTDVADTWIEQIKATDILGRPGVSNDKGLYSLRYQAADLDVLGATGSDGHTVDEWFGRRRNELMQAEAGEPENDDPNLFDGEPVY